jgi:hypothetical protein
MIKLPNYQMRLKRIFVLKAPAQPLLVVGNEGLLKELAGKVKRRTKKKKKRPISE